MFKKSIFTLLSAVTLAGALAPTVSTLASTQNSSPSSVSMKADSTSVVYSEDDPITDSKPVYGKDYNTMEELVSGISVSSDDVQKSAKTLKFYFETVGHFTENGEYEVTNVQALEAVMSEDTEEGRVATDFYKNVVIPYLEKGYVDYLFCVVGNLLGASDIRDCIDALIHLGTAKSLSTMLKDAAWAEAATLMLKVLAKFGYEGSMYGLVINLTYACITC
ncbi:hypothetical protein [Lacticaseibacillus jixiensis]|uniref:hypothetical protein n=1 Tax=Lacticaseibacillus jixiensis TaxID=3231926 RepID=UPI0036F315C7